MSSNRVDSKVGTTTESRVGEVNGDFDAATTNSENETKDTNSNFNRTSPGRSRYGRTIKPKSPKNEVASSPKACAPFPELQSF